MLSRLPGPGKEFMENYAIMLKTPPHHSMEKGIREEGKEEEEEKMIGVIGIPRLSPDGLSAEVGYAILPEYWGMGYASEALILFTSYYFNSERTFPTFPPPLSNSPSPFGFGS
jgi:RimJ/RimL family protein N-acetyltransferase